MTELLPSTISLLSRLSVSSANNRNFRLHQRLLMLEVPVQSGAVVRVHLSKNLNPVFIYGYVKMRTEQ